MAVKSVEFRDELARLIVEQFAAGENHISAYKIFQLYMGGGDKYVPDSAVDEVCRILPRIRRDLEQRSFHCGLVAEEFFTDYLDRGEFPAEEDLSGCIAGSGGSNRVAYGISRDPIIFMAYRNTVAVRTTSKCKHGMEAAITAAKNGDIPAELAAGFIKQQIQAMHPSNADELLMLIADRKEELDGLLQAHPMRLEAPDHA